MGQRVRSVTAAPTPCQAQPRQGPLPAPLTPGAPEQNTAVQVGWQLEVQVRMAIQIPLKGTLGDS